MQASSRTGTDQKRRRQFREGLACIAALILVYGVLFLLGITCPIKFITGVSCAGCGMTRAWLHLLTGDIRGALYYHPLFWLPPVVLAVLCLKNRLSRRLYRVLLAMFVGMFLVVYVYRMLFGTGKVVVFAPEDGALLRTVRYVIRLF